MNNEPIFSVLSGKNILEITGGKHTDYSGSGTVASPWFLAGPLGACGSGPNVNGEWMTTFTASASGNFYISGVGVDVWCGDSENDFWVQKNNSFFAGGSASYGSSSFNISVSFASGDTIRFGGNLIKVSNISIYTN